MFISLLCEEKYFSNVWRKTCNYFVFKSLHFWGAQIPKIPAHLFVTGSDAPYSPMTEAAPRWVTWSLSQADACRFIFLDSLNSINLRNPKPLGSFISKVSTKALLCGQTHKAANVFEMMIWTKYEKTSNNLNRN